MSLGSYSTGELLAELQRRARVEAETAPPFVSCEVCQHFKPVQDWDERSNPCDLGHVMRFVPPEDHNWPEVDSWGFTRDRCRDRCVPDPEETGRRSRPDKPPILRKVSPT